MGQPWMRRSGAYRRRGDGVVTTPQVMGDSMFQSRDRLPAKSGRLGWSLGRSAETLRARTAADYALFVSLDDSYASAGRKALGIASLLLVGPPVSGGRQTGLATLVDLQTGAVVWARHLDRSTGDLRQAEDARETAAALLENLPQ